MRKIVLAAVAIMLFASLAQAATFQGPTITFRTIVNCPYSLTPSSVSLAVGSSLTLASTFVVKDELGNVVTGTLSWSCSSTFATISNGVLTAVAPGGPVTISATKWGASASTTLMITPQQNQNFFTGGNITNPSGSVSLPDGRIIITDGANVKFFNADGSYQTAFTGVLDPAAGTHKVAYSTTTSLLYITDGLNLNKITVVDLSGNKVGTIGAGDFTGSAGDITIDTFGNLRIVDSQTGYLDGVIRIYDATTGVAQTTIGQGFLENPSGMVSAGNVTYIADRTSHEIKLFDNLMGVQIGARLGSSLSDPLALAYKTGYLGVLDNGAKKLMIFSTATWTKVTEVSYSGTYTCLSVDSAWQWIATDPTTGAKIVLTWIGQ